MLIMKEQNILPIFTKQFALKSIGFLYKNVNKSIAIIENYIIREWRHNYLLKIKE